MRARLKTDSRILSKWLHSYLTSQSTVTTISWHFRFQGKSLVIFFTQLIAILKSEIRRTSNGPVSWLSSGVFKSEMQYSHLAHGHTEKLAKLLWVKLNWNNQVRVSQVHERQHKKLTDFKLIENILERNIMNKVFALGFIEFLQKQKDVWDH